MPVKRTIIFNHTPKCGGSTLSQILKNQFKSCSIYSYKIGCRPDDPCHLNSYPDKKKNKIRLCTGHLKFGFHKYLPHENYTYLQMFREPVDRLVSSYHYEKQRGGKRHPDIAKMNFGEFVREDVKKG